MNVEEIQRILPHRFPFLLVDRVVEVTAGKKLVAYKNVTINDGFFQGHFPNHPVMPGVLIVEALAQAAALLAYRSDPVDGKSRIAYLTSLDGVRFRRPVGPGDRLMLEVEVVRRKGPVCKVRGVAQVDGQVVAEGELTAMVIDRGDEAAWPQESAP